MRTVVAAIALLLSPTAVQAQAPTVTEATITQVGAIESQITGKAGAPGVVGDNIKQGTYRFVSNATQMEARKGLSFGFEYRLVGAPDGAKVPIRKVTIFPAPGLRDPKTGEIAARDDYIEINVVGGLGMKGYALDNDWEAVPGVWTQQIWFGEQKLAEQKFTLTKP